MVLDGAQSVCASHGAEQMTNDNACKSYLAGQNVCADGFVQTAPCRSGLICRFCGAYSKDTQKPNCMKETLPDHLCTDDGAPIFYKRSNREEQSK